MTIVIEPIVKERPAPVQLPLEQMTRRQSFLLPWPSAKVSEREVFVTRIAARVYRYARLNDKQFSVTREGMGLRIARWE